MSEIAPDDRGYTVPAYFDLAVAGAFSDDDHVELLDGLVVASPQQGPLHAAVVSAADSALRAAVAGRATIRVQMPLIAGKRSVPEPDVAVVAGQPMDYARQHPTTALLVVEVADSSLPQDRLTKSRIYAGAGVPEYWIVNLRDRHLEIFTRPDVAQRLYTQTESRKPGDVVRLASLPGTEVAVTSLLPEY